MPTTIPELIPFLITVIIAGIFFWIVKWFVDQITLPDNIKQLIYVVIGLIMLLWLVNFLF